MKREFIGKSLLIEEDNERFLIVSDLHLGYDQALRESGAFIPGRGAFKQTMDDLERIFEQVGRVNKVILLGDVKHAIGTILREEWSEVLGIFEFLKKYCEEIIFVKGNHDVFLGFIARRYNVKILDFLIWKEYCFLHGDRDFEELYSKEVKTWVIGHVHPTLELSEGTKREKYKCFLSGSYKNKEVIVMPSFFPVVEGSGLNDVAGQLVWNFDLRNFEAFAVGEGNEVFAFGKIRKIASLQN